jgi:hypothetical protein
MPPLEMHLSTEAGQRDSIVAEARRWIGTPYHNGADVRGAGVDCGMLIVRVFVDTGLTPAFDPRPYPPDWHLHRGEEKYLGFIFDHCIEVDVPGPGDVVVFRYGRCYSHGGIVTIAGDPSQQRDRKAGDGRPGEADPLTIVHAFWPAQIVMEEDVMKNLDLADPARARRFFSYWAKARPAAAQRMAS